MQLRSIEGEDEMTTDAERIAHAWMTAPFLNDDDARAALLNLHTQSTPPAGSDLSSQPQDSPDAPTSPTPAGGPDPRLILCAEDGQYWCWYDRQFVGTHPNYHAADLALDDHERRLFEDGLIDAPPRAYTYACVAEVVGFLPSVISDAPADYACPCLTDPALPVEPAGPDARVGAATPQPFTRAPEHDLRPPLFWTTDGHTPLTCPRCDGLAAIWPVACPACGGAHLLSHCREFTAEWRRQEAEELRAGEKAAAHIARDFPGFLREYAALTEDQRAGVVRTYCATQRHITRPEGTPAVVGARWALLCAI